MFFFLFFEYYFICFVSHLKVNWIMKIQGNALLVCSQFSTANLADCFRDNKRTGFFFFFFYCFLNVQVAYASQFDSLSLSSLINRSDLFISKWGNYQQLLNDDEEDWHDLIPSYVINNFFSIKNSFRFFN